MNWEYKSIHKPNNLNMFGGTGWELVAVIESDFIFKRPMHCINCKYYLPSGGQKNKKPECSINMSNSLDGCINFESNQ